MPIIRVEIMETIDEREMEKNKERKKDRKEQGEQSLQRKGES